MVKKCCVSRCRSESYKNCGINFFHFPKSPHMRQKWIDVVPRYGEVKEHSVICHLHFKPEDILVVSSRPRLTPDAVPSIFGYLVPNPPSPENINEAQSPVELMKADSTTNKVMPSNSVQSSGRSTRRAAEMRCVVPDCDSHSNETSEEITYHKFPREPSARAAWQAALGGGAAGAADAVCSRHFPRDAWRERPGGARELRADAVPELDHDDLEIVFKIDDDDFPSETGACDVKACRLCFTTDCMLYPISAYKTLSEAYETMTGLLLEAEERLPQYACARCARRLLNGARVRSAGLRAHSLLLELLRDHSAITTDLLESMPSEHDDGDIETERELDRALAAAAWPPAAAADSLDSELSDLDARLNGATASGGGDDEHDAWPPLGEDHPPEARGEAERQEEELNALLVGTKYQCDRCPFGSANVRVIANHLRAHAAPVSHVCERCGYRSLSRAALRVHQQRHAPPRAQRHACAHCGKRWPSRYDLRRHELTHTGERPHACDLCERRFATRDGLRVHLWRHSGARPHRCPVCDKAFVTRGRVTAHLATHACARSHECDVCGKRYASARTLADHRVAKHRAEPAPPRRRQRCGVCGLYFADRGAYRQHVRWNAACKPHQCSACPKRFTLRTTLRAHERVHAEGRQFGCSVCGKAFQSRATLQMHTYTHTGERPHGCGACGRRFAQRSSLTTHALTHTGERPYACATCGVTFNNHANLRRHEQIHTAETFQCAACGKSFGTQHCLTQHRARHARAALRAAAGSPSDVARRRERARGGAAGAERALWHLRAHRAPARGPRAHVCVTCGEAFPRRCALVAHARSHSPERAPRATGPAAARPCACFVCGRARRRAATHGLAPGFACEFCGKRLSTRSSLKIHLRGHTGEKPYSCEYCDERFSIRYALRIHTAKHTGEKPYQCDECGKAFASKTVLRFHVAAHAGRLWACAVCGRRFSSRSNMQRHAYIHAGGAHACDLCGKVFGTRQYLRQHLDTHAHAPRFVCGACGRAFRYKRSLKNHVKMHPELSEQTETEIYLEQTDEYLEQNEDHLYQNVIYLEQSS